MKRYSDWKNGHEPFYPNHLLKQALIVALMTGALIAMVGVYLIFEPGAAAAALKPQWYILPIYKIASLLKGAGGLIICGLCFAILLMWPYIDRNPKKNIYGRPGLMAASILFVCIAVLLGIWGMF